MKDQQPARASFAWSGNDKVGAGRQTIVKSRPDESIQIKLEFERPFKDVCDTEFKFEPKDEQTLVTWTMSGKRNFMAKAMSLIIDCDKMVGPDFERDWRTSRQLSNRRKKPAMSPSIASKLRAYAISSILLA